MVIFAAGTAACEVSVTTPRTDALKDWDHMVDPTHNNTLNNFRILSLSPPF
jgi:hypothetical protein